MFPHRPKNSDPAFLAAHASTQALYNRLGNDITTLSDGGDQMNQQALADASERYNTAGAQLGTSTTVGELGVARSIVIEGLHATRLVRKRLDPGPDPAELPADPTPAETHAWGSGLGGGIGRGRGGLGSALGVGAAGGLLGGLLGGEVLGELFGGGGGDRGWGDGGDDGGGWGEGGGF